MLICQLVVHWGQVPADARDAIEHGDPLGLIVGNTPAVLEWLHCGGVVW